ncbi:MAG: cell division protein FtsA [Alphaproteobacteria bacterium]|nr:cell division protein FtsA [Alphaproteobacteria bacterium]MDP7487730.1 cell division protein FtsA [Alphaproteobacteria bacterium]
MSGWQGGSYARANTDGLIVALDVGTAKIACLIAEDEGDGLLHVVGVGHKVSRGLRNGAVIDIEAAEQAVREAVHGAESMAGETVRSGVINLSSGQPQSRCFSVEVEIGGHEVGDADLRRIHDVAQRQPSPADRTVVHALPVAYGIDGVTGIRDPRGLFGDRLSVTMHVATAGRGAVRNLSTCLARCHLNVDDLVLSAYAAGQAVLVKDERELGAVCVDLGAGTTSIAAFHGDRLVHTDCLPIGGAHVTNDIARGLATPLANAERIKTLHGSVIADAADDRRLLDVPTIGEGESIDVNIDQVPRAQLIDIIRPRLEETFEMVCDRLATSGLAELAGHRVVLTGGASQMNGIANLAGQILDSPVRLGKPRALRGLAESTSGPAFAVAAGLLQHAFETSSPNAERRHELTRDPPRGLGRIGHWLRENF